ncbi:MAG: PKD domain-containing protein, partial [Planctomycetota bacterium]|nr:PKD domain-containing protein [Planctomycetota bacterium]
MARNRRRKCRQPARTRGARQPQLEQLEDRRLLAVAALPNQWLPTGQAPLDLQIAPLHADGLPDLAVLSRDGTLTVARNAGHDQWLGLTTRDLGVGPANGLRLTRLDADLLPDLVVQGPDTLHVFRGDGTGDFTLRQTHSAPIPGQWSPAGGGRVGIAASLLNADTVTDLVTVSPGSDEVLVLLGRGDGTLADPVAFPSGGREPVVVVVGNFLGEVFPDLAVGHSDGTLTFLEGLSDGSFQPRPKRTIDFRSVPNFGSLGLVDLTVGDWDGDGDADLAVSGINQVYLLQQNPAPLSSSPIANGSFSAGLTGWTTEVVGQTPGVTAGTINALGGVLQLTENESFLVSAHQTFLVPPQPQTLSVDIVALGLDAPADGVPDAVELSLLDDASQSLVPTIGPNATSFFNVGYEARAPDLAAGTRAAYTTGVTFDGRTVTLDISGLQPDTLATLYLDLIGNPPGTQSVVAFDNVCLTPDRIFADTFTVTPLAGPFGRTAGIASGDVDGDGHQDLIVADAGRSQLVVYNGDGRGQFTRSELDLASFGSEVSAVTTGLLTDGDRVAVIAVTLRGSDVALSPLGSGPPPDATGPRVSLLEPAPDTLVRSNVAELRLQFSEGVQDAGAAGRLSVTNPAAYQLWNFGPNGTFEDGQGDDRLIPISSVTYSRATQTAVLTIAASAAPLADAGYQLSVAGADPNLAIVDLAGNRLADGQDVLLSWAVNRPPVLVSADSVSGREGGSVAFSAGFQDPGFHDPHTATIDWGDGSAAGVMIEADGDGQVTAGHIYADNGTYAISVTLWDSAGNQTQRWSLATIANVPPAVTAARNQLLDEGQTRSLDVVTFTDPGFSRTGACGGIAGSDGSVGSDRLTACSTVETFTATIDWGDGSALEAVVPRVTQGRPGVATSGTVWGQHAYRDEGFYSVTVTVTDDDQGSQSARFKMLVRNDAPLVTGMSDLRGVEGQRLDWVGEFSDPGTLDTHRATLDWGDGSQSVGQVDESGGQGTVRASHVYADNGTYTVQLEVQDDQAATTHRHATAEISNGAPAVIATSDQRVSEGSLLAIDVAHFTDPGFTRAGASVGLPIGPTAETFTATIDWGDGSSQSGVLSVTAGAPGRLTSGTVGGQHVYASEGAYRVTVTVTDDDQGAGTAAFTVLVDNVRPTVTAATALQGDEGQRLDFAATFADPGRQDTHTASVFWGDGSSSAAVVTPSPEGGSVAASHVYADNGSYTVRVEVTDNGGGSACLETTATIANVAPTVTASPNRRLPVGQAVTLPVATFTDPGFTRDGACGGIPGVINNQGRMDWQSVPDGLPIRPTTGDACPTTETFTATINWGDGSPVSSGMVTVEPGGSGVRTTGVVSGAHAYAALGAFTVTVTVRDDDLGLGTASLVYTAGAKLYVVDQCMVSIFRYGATGSPLGPTFLVSANILPRSVDTNPAGDTLWVVDDSRQVFVYGVDGTPRGSWKTPGVGRPEGIGTDGQHVWIVDAAAARVSYFADGARFVSGSYTANSSFPLSTSNRRPAGLSTDGRTFWVTDSTAGMFVYDATGTLLGQWQLDPRNRDPRGVGWDPATGDFWIVDAAMLQVFRYAGAATRRSGSQTAAAVLTLGPFNGYPVGIADPTTPTTIQVGDVVTGAIPSLGEVNLWNFSGVKDQLLFVDFQVITGGTLQFRLLSPTGVVVASDYHNLSNYLDRGPLTLPENGTYTLELTGLNNQSTPSYQFQLWNVPAPDERTIGVGDVAQGAIETPGTSDVWRFDATANQTVLVDFQQISGGGTLEVRLGAPDGTTTLYSASNFLLSQLDSGRLVLPTTGTYTLVVDGYGDDTASYSFQLWNVPAADERTIQVGDVVQGAIETPGVRDVWQFTTAASNLTLFVDFQQISGGTADVRLLAPDGTTTLYSASSFLLNQLDSGRLVLPTAGTYTLVVDGYGDDTPTYQFQLWDVRDVTQPLSLNTPVSGQTVPLQNLTYTFDGQSGQRLVLDVLANAGNQLGFTLWSPAGTALFASQTGDQILPPLPANGTYRLVVTGKSPGNYGPFTFRLQQADSPQLGVPDSRGTDFWLTFPHVTHENGEPALSLVLTAAQDTSGVVTIPRLNWLTTFDVRAGERVQIPLGYSAELSWESDRIENQGIHVTTQQEVTVYGVSQECEGTDAYLALPTDVLGREYLVLSYPNPKAVDAELHTQFAVVATRDGTTVTITPTVKSETRLAGVPFTVTLDCGQVYHLRSTEPSPADLTGTVISANQPVVVLSGHRGANVPLGFPYANPLVEQLPPVTAWGRHFVTLPLATRTRGDTFRFLAAENGTQVTIDGQLAATLDRGQFLERVLTAAAEITSNRPLLVGQYATGTSFDGVQGDPSLMLVPPLEQFQADYRIASVASDLLEHFINIVAPTSAVGRVTLDGAPIPVDQFFPLGTSGFSGAQLTVAPAAYHLAGPAPFGVFVYGFGSHDAYSYPGGLGGAPLGLVSSLVVTPDSAQALVGAEQVLTAVVADTVNGPLVGVRVDFFATGANQAFGFDVTDAAGQAHFAYVGQNAGIDSIVAQVGARTGTASVSWTDVRPRLLVTSPSEGSQFLADSVQLVTGQALPGATHVPIAAVTVNGQPVDAVDAAGNFFTLVSVGAGQNVFTFTATDALGKQVSQTLTVAGLAPSGTPLDFTNLQDVTSSGQFNFSGTTFNRHTNTLWAQVSLTNASGATVGQAFQPDVQVGQAFQPDVPVGQAFQPDVQVGQAFQPDLRGAGEGSHPAEALAAPALAAFAPLRPPTVALTNPDTTLSDGRLAVAFDTEIPAEGLAPGATSALVPLAWSNPQRERFAIDLSLLTPINALPSFTSIPVSIAIAGQPYEYLASATDPNGDQLVFSLELAPAGLILIPSKTVSPRPGTPDNVGQAFQPDIQVGQAFQPDSQAGKPDLRNASERLLHWTPDLSQLGVHTITLRVSDGHGGSATQSFSLRVIEPPSTNHGPLIVSRPATTVNLANQPSVTYQYPLQALDPDGDELTFSLVAGPPGMTISPRADNVGQAFQPDVQVGQAFQPDSQAGKPDLRAGVESLLTWTPDAAQLGSHPITLRVSDGRGGSDTQTFLLKVVNVQPAEIRGITFHDLDQDGVQDPGETGLATWTVYLDSNANGRRDVGESSATTDPTGKYAFTGLTPGPYSVTLEPQPAWTITAPTWRVGGVSPPIPGSTTGTYSITLTAAQTLTALNFGVVSETSGNQPPTFTSTPLTQAKVGRLYRYDVQAIDSEGNPPTFTLLRSPVGMTVDADRGTVFWTPTADQQTAQDVLLQVSDGQGGVAVQAFRVFVAPKFQYPTISSTPYLLATVGEPYEYTIVATSPNDESLAFSLVTGPPDATLTLSPALHWTPTAADVGWSLVQIAAADAGGRTVYQTFEIEVRTLNQPPQFTSTPLTTVLVGEIYRYAATATDSEDDFTFSLVAGPPGLQINSTTGFVTWTPSRPGPTVGQAFQPDVATPDFQPNSQAGKPDLRGGSPFAVTLRVTDDRGAFTDQSFTLTVLPDTVPPAVRVLLTPGLAIPGETVTIQVVAIDNVSVSDWALEIDGQAVPLGGPGRVAQFTATRPGLVTLVGIATDSSGNVGRVTQTLRVLDPSDTEPPQIEITSPASGSRVTYLTDIAGTVTDPNLESYRLEYALAGTNQWTTFAQRSCNSLTPDTCPLTLAVNGVLGTFDPTRLTNDVYEIRVVAQDFSGNIRREQITIEAAGQAKLGNFHLEFTDLSVPLAGIPITIGRV